MNYYLKRSFFVIDNQIFSLSLSNVNFVICILLFLKILLFKKIL